LVLSGITGAFVGGVSLLGGGLTARFTLSGIASQGTLNASLAAGAVTDTFGNPNAAFSASYQVDVGTVGYPIPLLANVPLGSLIYDPIASGLINSPGDIDTFSLSVDPGQTITVLVTATSPGLQPAVILRNPAGTTLGTDTADAAGQPALLQTLPAATSGSYTIAVSGAGGTIGNYTVQVTLNAALENEGTLPAVTNNTLATAQNIDASFIALSSQQATGRRGGVMGAPDTAGPGYSATAVAFSFTDISTTGATVLTNADDATVPVTIPFTFNFFGTNFTSLFVSSNGLITFGAGNSSFSNATLSANPVEAAIAPFWDDLYVFNPTSTARVLTQTNGAVGSRQLILQWDKVNFFPNSGSADTLTFQAILFEGSNNIRFNYLDLATAGDSRSEGTGATVGIKRANPAGSQFLELANNTGPNTFVGTGKSTLIAPLAPTPDYYAFTVGVGETVSLVATVQTTGTLGLELRSSTDGIISTGALGATNVTRSISNILLNTAGTYYARVNGANAPYSLVVTRNAAFETEANDSFTTADSLAGNVGALGAIALGASPTTVVPSGLATAEGGALNAFPFHSTSGTMRYQQIYAASQFAAGGVIDALRFRRDVSQGAFTTTNISAQITLSHAATTVGTLSSTFASNIGAGAVTVFNGLLNLSSSGTGTPNPFDIIVDVANTFTYNPALGDLLVEVRIFTIAPTARFFDATTVFPTLSKRVFASSSTATTGTVDNTALVTQFAFLAPPNEDWYSFNVPSTANEVWLGTSTPADGSGQFPNTLNPRIELFDPSGAFVAGGTPLSAGNRNEFIEFLPALTGPYRVRVTSEANTTGEYFLGLDPVAGAPRVVSTSIAPDAELAPGTLTIQVTFSEPMRASNLTSDDFSLRSHLRAINIGATTFSFNAARTVLSLTYSNLADDNYTLTLDSGTNAGTNFTDLAGNALDGEFAGVFPSGNGTAGGDFVLDFSTDLDSEAYPIPMAPKLPPGSLIYDPTLTRVINSADDADTYLLPVDAGQTITVLVTAAGSSLQPQVEMFDPDGISLADDAAAGPGLPAILHSIPTTTAGTYEITVNGVGASVGRYSIQILLNAGVELEHNGGNSNETTAEDLDVTALDLGNTASHLAVLGTTGSGAVLAGENFEGGVLPASITTFSSDPTGRIRILSPGASGNASGFALVMDRSTSTPLVGVLNEAIYTVDLTGLAQATLSFAHVSFGDETTALPVDFTGHVNGDGVAISDDGVNWRTILSAPTNTAWTTATFDLDAAAAAAGMTLGPNFQIKFQQFDDFPIPSDGRGFDHIQIVAADTADTYSFTLGAGETVSVALTGLAAGSLEVELRDSSNTLVAAGVGGATNVTRIIDNAQAGAAGTYYARVLGTGTVPYSLVITPNAAFDTEGNDSSLTAQDISPARGVLGSVEATTINFTDSGWYDSTGFHGPTNQNYITGKTNRNFFIFDLSAVSEPINGAHLRLSMPVGGYNSPDATETYTLFDVSTPVATLQAGGSGLLSVYDDLGTGTALGSLEVSRDNVTAVVSVVLNAAGVAALNAAAGGQFAIGGAVTTPDGPLTQSVFGFSGNVNDVRQLVLSFAPSDWYSIEITSTDNVITLETSTPADGEFQFDNRLDPHLELFDPLGLPVALGADLPDGRNERIEYDALLTGTYRARVTGEGHATWGEYFLAKNVSPALTLNAPDIDENSMATISGEIHDPEASDAHTVVIVWGPGDETTLNLPPGVLEFSDTRFYADDNPTGDPVNIHPISVSVVDGLGASGAASTSVTVHNVDPVITSLVSSHPDPTAPSADGHVTISGAFTDVGLVDTHRVLIDWGDGSPPVEAAVNQATRTFSASHDYLDGGIYPVSATAIDDDLGSSLVATTTAAVEGAGLVDGVLYVIGSPGNDSARLTLNADLNLAVVDLALNLQARRDFDRTYPLSDVERIVTYLNQGFDFFQVTEIGGAVASLVPAPVIPVFADGGDGDDTIRTGSGDDFLLPGEGNDDANTGAGNDEVFDVGGWNDKIVTGDGNDRVTTSIGNDVIDTGNGNDYVNSGGGFDNVNTGEGDDEVIDESGNNFIRTGPGNDRVTTGDGSDDIGTGEGNDVVVDAGGFNKVNTDSGDDEVTTGAGNDVINTGADNDRVASGGGNDNVNTGEGDDRVVDSGGSNTVRTEGGNDVVITSDGDDNINTGAGDDYADAGAGNDTVTGGDGNDTLLGAAGNDKLTGGLGFDILIGGLGADSLQGNSDEDLLVAGFTDYDNDQIALAAIMAEWSAASLRTYAERVGNLTDGTGAALRNNGNVFLTDQTVHDDGDVDTLTGSTGLDWFFANLDETGAKDKISGGLEAGEEAVDID
jgi:Ca2+-binding RTX toxin-like protein